MSQVAESPVTHRLRMAAIAAGGVAAVLVLQEMIGNFIFVAVSNSPGTVTGPGYDYDYWGYLWQTLIFGMLVILAFVVGVWFSLWRFAPVAGGLSLTTVVLRGLLAAAVGAVLVFLVHLGFNLFWPFSGMGSVFGGPFPGIPWGGIIQAGNRAFEPGAAAFLQHGPVVVLVVLLVWFWLGRRPSQHAGSAEMADG